MEKSELLTIESKCIQEEAPWCNASCPIHVDARKFIGLMSQGKWQDARKIIDKTLPFSSTIGRICDHPCENACKRAEAGGPIAIGALERCCVQNTAPERRIQILPSRDQRVAVLGDGLDSLTVCWDLVRKGYTLSLFSSGDQLGEGLMHLAACLVPEQVLREEVAVLRELGVTFNIKQRIAQAFYEEIRKEFQSVYVGSDAGQALDLNTTFDPVTLATGEAGVFTGGARAQGQEPSPIGDVGRGRRAALTMDRYLKKVSLTVGREKEGPYETRLYTAITGLAQMPRTPMADPATGYTREEALKEAKRCLQCQCLECVKVCEYLKGFHAYPKVYARNIHNNDIAITKNIDTNRLVNACSLCGLCTEVCPNDFSMSEVCLNARRRMFQKGKMPSSFHEFGIRDMLFSNGDKFAMARHEPGMEKSAFVFFPGCQLSGSSPEHVEQVYQHLRNTLSGGVGLMLRCCGAMAEWAGREELFQESLRTLSDQCSAMGDPVLIVACSTCYDFFKRYLLGIEIRSLWEVLKTTGLPETQTARAYPQPLAIHDPCTARHEKGVQESVRLLLKQLGCTIEEMPLSGVLTECCGYGGLMYNASPDLAKSVVKRRAAESPVDYVAYCAMCRDSLATTGKRVLHLLDLIWNTSDEDAAARKNPGFSSRQENRARLKRKLLQKIWNEKTKDMESYEKITLHIPAEVKDLMEERRILIEDLQQAVEYAEKTGRKFRDPRTGRFLASYCPTKVTYWVEYVPLGDGYAVHRAYSHRMRVSRGEKE